MSYKCLTGPIFMQFLGTHDVLNVIALQNYKPKSVHLLLLPRYTPSTPLLVGHCLFLCSSLTVEMWTLADHFFWHWIGTLLKTTHCIFIYILDTIWCLSMILNKMQHSTMEWNILLWQKNSLLTYQMVHAF